MAANERREVFGWQGFRFDHPADWAPVVLIGTAKSGRVRLDAKDSLSIQVRWKASPHPPDGESALRTYLKNLHRDAARARTPFSSNVQQDGAAWRYSWSSKLHALGIYWFAPELKRTFLVEAVGTSKNPPKKALEAVWERFELSPGDPWLWSLYGLALKLPTGFQLVQPTLRAGRTTLEFRARGARLVAERWGFGRQLVEKHGLAEWAASLHRLPQGSGTTDGPRFHWKGERRIGWFPSRTVLVRNDEERNHLTSVVCDFRSKDLEPQWDWFA